MNPALRMGVELPPLPAAGGRPGPEPEPGGALAGSPGAGPAGSPGEGEEEGAIAVCRRIGAAAAAAGAGTVWITGAPPEGGGSGVVPPWCDPFTLAGALAHRLEVAMIGVVSCLPAGRHPSVVARDLTTLDVLSGGRAALRFGWDPARPAALTDICEHLVDAAALCTAMLRGEAAYDGPRYRVSGAWNLPPPRRPGGPPVLVDSPAALSASLVSGRPGYGGAAGLARRLGAVVDAVVCPPDPRTVSAWRTVLDGGQSRGARKPGLLCAFDPRGERVRGRSLPAARDGGADGVIVRLAPDSGRAVAPYGPMSAELPDLLAASYAPWTGPGDRGRGTSSPAG